jgi:lipoprotein-anchoring transpeptidase ErfK/SrfK
MRRLIWLPIAAALSTFALIPSAKAFFLFGDPLDSNRGFGQQEAPQMRTAPEPGIPREVVAYYGREAPGTVIVNTQERRLYLVQSGHTAIRYGIGVGREGFQWAGVRTIERKAMWPDWRPPAQMLQRRPDLPRYMPGGEDNPLGARAMYLSGTLFRIHGSNEPESIGHAVSSGCIRMLNEDVIDLYDRVKIGTKVVVMR